MFLLLLLACLSQSPAQSSVDWTRAEADLTAIGCADMNGDGIDDLLATYPDGRLLVSLSLPDRKASEWKVLSKRAPPDTVAIAVIATDRRSLRKCCLLTPTRFFAFHLRETPGDIELREHTWRLKGVSEVSGESLPEVPLRVAEAFSVGHLLWVHTPEDQWWKLRTAGSFFIGPYPDPRPSLSPVSPPRAESPGSEPVQARWKLWGDISGDGQRDSISVFPVGRSSERNYVIRVTLAPASAK